MAIPVKINEATATKRRVYFQLVDATDGITPETGEAAGQPQISTNGAAFTNTGIGTLTHMGNGRYYADVTQAATNGTEGDRIETRYKSANTAEGVGDTLFVVSHNQYDIESTVWDALLTTSSHNNANSAGKRLRQKTDMIAHDGTAQGPGANGNQIQFAATASSVSGSYDPTMITLIGGTGAGQSRMILDYNGATKIATVDRTWRVNPDATTEYIVTGHPGREHVNEGLAQAGGVQSITLNASASNVDGAYVGQVVFVRSGTAEDQVARVTSYNGTTKVASVDHPWDTQPDATSAYVMLATPYFVGENVGLNTITLQIIDQDTNAVAGATVDVYNSSGRYLRRLQDPDLDGNVIAYLDDGTYTIRVVAPYWEQTTKPQTVVATADEAVNVAGTLWSAPAPSSADLCVIYGDLKTIIGGAGADLVLSLEPDYRTTAQGNIMVGPKKTATSDANGYVSIEAVRGSKVIVWLQEARWSGIALTVPDAASQDLATWTT
jgi:hypothetical protein